MIKLLSSASVVALLAISPAVAQTTTTTPPAATQDTSKSTTPSTPSVTQEKSAVPSTQPAVQDLAAVTMTEDQAKGWVDKVVYSSDNKNIGEVVEFKRGSDNKVTELHADLGGFLGMGETRVKLMPSEFKLQGDRVVLNITEEQAKALPKLEKK